MQKLSLKPVKAELKRIRKQLVTESKTAKAARKQILKEEIDKIDMITATVLIALKNHNLC
jgi:hypothetical protein